jgi:hypothetical protein
VAVGRVRWIAGTKTSGYDNSAWYCFDARHSAGPILYAKGAVPVLAKVCACGRTYQPQRSDAKCCSNACRQRAYRERLNVTQV